jgi:hypothetical protein
MNREIRYEVELDLATSGRASALTWNLYGLTLRSLGEF